MIERVQFTDVVCRVVMRKRGQEMNDKRSVKSIPKTQRKTAVRASISFPPDLYRNLERIAQQKKVSLAWVVRDAAETYITTNLPLQPKERYRTFRQRPEHARGAMS